MGRQAVLDRAASMIGNPDPDTFWKVVLPSFKPGAQRGLAWCGGFALWAWTPEGINRKWKLGSGFLSTSPAFPQIPLTKAQPADVAYWHTPYQHHALFVSLQGETIHTIDGNQGAPNTVRAKARNLVPFDQVQRALNTHMAKGSTLLKDDGVAGPKTRAAIKAFQAKAGLEENSLADFPTIKALGLTPTVVIFSLARVVP